jgi:hypothetical protein
MTKKFEIADLVKWYDYYEDRIVRDAGRGIVVEVVRSTPGDAYEWINYSVYKFKTSKLAWFETSQLEEIIPPVPKR